MSVIDDDSNFLYQFENSSLEDTNAICHKLAEDIVDGKVKLVKIVELLGPLLTNTDVNQREKGVLILSEILVTLKIDYLSAAELTFLTAFFCDRLKDHHSLAHAVFQGVLSMINMDNLPSDSPVLICTSLFSNLHCQTLTQPERNMVYRIFQKLLMDRLEDLKPLGISFVLGFITAIDGERDPNNLMLVFSILPLFLTSFPLLQLAEEAFNVISCYFPIDFNAAAEEQKTYNREDLAMALAPCLTAVPDFAEFCIPLVLEKLDSHLRVAKLDSLHVLREGCKIWTINHLEPHLIDIWLSLKKELLPGNDVPVRNSASETLVVLISKLNNISDDDRKEKILSSFIDDIISSTTGLLSDVNLSLFSPAVNVLVTACSASELVCKKVVTHVVPKLYLLRPTSSQESVTLFHTLNLFLKTQLKFYSGISSNIIHDYPELWSLFPNQCLEVTVNDQSSDVQASAFEGLITVAPYLSDADRTLIYERIELVLSKDNVLIRNNCIRCVKTLAELYPLEVMHNLVKSKLLIDKGCIDPNSQKWRIEVLCALLMLNEFTENISDILMNVVDQFSPCTSIVLHSVRNLLESSDLKNPSINKLSKIFIPRLIKWWINNVDKSNEFNKFELDNILVDTAAIVECLMRSLDSSLQSEIMIPLLQIIIPPEETGNYFCNLNLKENCNANDLYSRIILLEGLLESLRQDVVIPVWQMLTTSLSNVAFNSSHDLTHLSASRLLATLLNKQNNDECSATVLGVVAKSMEEKLKDKNTEENAVRLLSWVTKALVLRGHSLMSYWLDKLTDQLCSWRIGKEAADGFRLIMTEDKLHLTMNSHCTVRILYKQRLFQRIPTLVSSSRSCLPNCKVNYLLAIAHFVQAVPRVVLLPYLRQIVLPMVESLDYEDSNLELITLETLSSLLLEKESSLESYLDTFIPRFLTLAQQSPFMKVRIAALLCIKNYANYSPVLLMPYVQTVIGEIEVCLDDKKRLVRKAAVEARLKWFLVGAPSDDD